MTTVTGTGAVLRFQLRRDRLRLPLWVAGVPMFALYFSVAITVVTDHGTELGSFAPILGNPVTMLVGGPGYGYDHLTVPRMIAGVYLLYLMLAAAVLGMTTVIRHTRVDEQTGRSGLLRAGSVGRHAPLAASVILVAGMSVIVGALCSVVFAVVLGTGDAGDGAGVVGPGILAGTGIGLTALVFAGVGAVTAQLTVTSRTATGLAGLVLAVSFVVRGLGDMSRGGDGTWSFLSWLSPLGWVQQTAPWTLDRWWPLLFCPVCVVVCMVVGGALAGRRDLGAGLLPDRPGPAVAPGWVRSVPALVWRLQRSGVVGWALSLVIGGLVFGLFADAIGGGADDLPSALTDLLGGRDGLIDGYLGFMGLFFGLTVTAYALLEVQDLAEQEEQGFTATVLASGVGRMRWYLSWTGVRAVTVVLLLGLAGLGEGVGAALVTGRGGEVVSCLAGHVLLAPAVWVFGAAAAALHGLRPEIWRLVWVAFVVAGVLSLFGGMMTLGDDVLQLSPYEHVGRVPGGEADVVGLVVLTAVAVVLTGVGVLGFSRRDLRTP